MGLWTYPAKPPEEPYAYILDDEGIISTIQIHYGHSGRPSQDTMGIRAILRLSGSRRTLYEGSMSGRSFN